MRFFAMRVWRLLKRLGNVLNHVLFLGVFSVAPLTSLFLGQNKDTNLQSTISVFCFILVFFIVAIVFALRSHSFVERLVALIYSLAFVVSAIGVFALTYQWRGLKFNGVTVDHPPPLDCLYFSIITWTTVGYGEITPSDHSKMVAASEALIGYVCMALLMAIIVKFLDSKT